MTTVRIAKDADKDAWNQVALKAPHATYGHTWEWRQSVEEGFGSSSLCLVAEEQGEIVGIYSAFLYRKYREDGSLATIKRLILSNAMELWSPLFLTWDYGGPCVRKGAPADACSKLISEMEILAKRRGAMDLWVSPFQDTSVVELLKSSGYRIAPRFTSLIDLTQSEEDLWKNLKGETRSQIRQGQKFGLQAVESTNSQGLVAFYSCLESVADRTDMTLPARSFFETLFKTLVPAGMLRIYEVKHEGRSIGSALFFYYKGVIVARYWAAFKDGLKLRPYHVLIWHIITEAKKLGFHTCDFGGMPPDEDNGIYKFKKGWGVRIEHVDWFVKPLRFGKTRALAKRALSNFPGCGKHRAAQAQKTASEGHAASTP